MKKKQITKDTKLSLLAKKYGMQVCSDIESFRFVKKKVQYVPYAFAKQHFILPLDEDKDHLIVAVADPFSFEPLDDLRLMKNKKIKPLLCIQEDLLRAIEICYHQKEGETKQLVSKLKKRKTISIKKEGYDLLEKEDKSSLVQLLNAIVVEAIQQKASDIHFEPLEEGLKIRFRIDGILQERHIPPAEYHSQITTRIKVMAKMDIAENRLPQDGRIKLRLGEREIDFRVSTIPVVYGERITMRILDRSNVILGIEKLGMSKEVKEQFKRYIQSPEGIILVTGPTGSGKTTSLYSAIMQINSSEKNIMTIEDPVEYKLPDIAQIHVNPKINLTFAAGLRHILRQDPDAIMVGEIRDSETAEIAIQSALTGHLVFSTLHTNDAPSAIARLCDMGIEPYLLSSSVIAILAQRLVRKICSRCRYSYTPTIEELKILGYHKKDVSKLVFYKGKGCKHCFQTGYQGRHGIYEWMPMTPVIKKQIISNVGAHELKMLAKNEGLITLLQSGLELVKLGITTSSEVMRVTEVTN